MTYEVLGAGALNYEPCRYGESRILFRGPQRRLDVPYVAFIGGTETYGKFINAPFPAMVESQIGVNCVNFGVANAGIDAFLNDCFVLEAANRAQATVIQIIGAQNLSNRFYTVHPRRNDRFLKASALLASIYPEVDFSEFHFNRHMLGMLHQVSHERFELVVDEVQAAWTARMKLMLRRITGRTVLLWFADHMPPADNGLFSDPGQAPEPLFITRPMIDELTAHATSFVEVAASAHARAAGTKGMSFGEMETMAARKMLGPQAHGEAAMRLSSVLENLV
ncbi:hypothetical protein CEP88_16870 [Roseobacter denitrificans]|uniref:DUF6473 domain-containing protein n=1 Tax=Roseobacter denitrificans (strain ATCC 33942 / OCh 114) TaxID=375451 RepID=Q16AG7_ROSDO|nr:DUF6473 family protein [Roseobacter denitrificans]ABG31026.1 hypothetical protein RD1_1386 [Roseobacter denitrificans OCh 114]AVL54104.1 hypothetical protein CEP88_16870 [Roseobacter denitrificans]SFG12369.1 hypothetical protein SAMN05443635_10811 [Roseobacter denitrificans OCh 114]